MLRIASSITAKRCVPAFSASSFARPMSTNTNTVQTTPEQKADAIINFFPGTTPAAKAGSLLAAASVAAYAISKEVYVFDHEFMEMMCIFGAYYIWYKGGKDSALSYLKDRRQAIVSVLSQARADHRAVVQERIDHIGKMKDIVPVTDALYDMSREMAKYEAEVYALEQKLKVKQQLKSTLDAWVRYESFVREQEQKQVAETVINKVKESLKDPKVQQSILQQTLADFEKLAVSKTA